MWFKRGSLLSDVRAHMRTPEEDFANLRIDLPLKIGAITGLWSVGTVIYMVVVDNHGISAWRPLILAIISAGCIWRVFRSDGQLDRGYLKKNDAVIRRRVHGGDEPPKSTD